jgi:hypothetical protein
LADKSDQLILEALTRAAAAPDGLPLYGSKAAPGLFAATALAKQAASACKERGYVRALRTESKGRTRREICAITEKGLDYLLSRLSPGTNGSDTWIKAVLSLLHARSSALEDSALPELYRAAQSCQPTLTIGQFHDGLRTLHARGQVRLHPWTGPLYELPEPSLALLVGHEIAYYAST